MRLFFSKKGEPRLMNLRILKQTTKLGGSSEPIITNNSEISAFIGRLSDLVTSGLKNEKVIHGKRS